MEYPHRCLRNMSLKQQTQLEFSFTGEAVKSSVKSFTLSKRYVQIMVRASILNILYRRVSFNDSSLKIKKYEHIPFVVFKTLKNVKEPLLKKYLSWVNGIKDAIDKNYLSEIFVFMKKDEEILETYRFALKYNMEEGSENTRTFKFVKDDTMAFFQEILDLGKNEKLCIGTELYIEFKYSDATPAEYEPPGFVPAVQPYCLKTTTFNNKYLGRLNTGYHKLTCKAQVSNVESITVSDGENTGAEEDSMDLVQDISTKRSRGEGEEEAFVPNKKIIVHEEFIILDDNDRGAKKSQNNRKTNFNTSNITINDSFDAVNTTLLSNDVPTEAGAPLSDCVCQLSLPATTPVCACVKCGRRCHVPCCGFLREDDAVGVAYACNRCADPTDKIMATFGDSGAHQLAITRLILCHFNKTGTLPDDIMELIDEPYIKQLILRKLKDFQIYFIDPETNKGVFNRVHLDEVVPHFFNMDNSQFFH